MPIEVAGITLNRIHKVDTVERADFVSHRIPGLEGNVVQDMGRYSVALQIEGIFYGPTAQEDLETLRDAYKTREPVDFLADVTGQAYFSQVVLSRLEVHQRAGEPDQFSYTLALAEYVPPPEPESGFGLDVPGVDMAINLEALDFMDMIQLPDLLSLPEIADPAAMIEPLKNSVSTLFTPVQGAFDQLKSLFP